MRTILVFLTVLFGLSAYHVLADELVLGRVLSVDQDHGTVAIEVLDGPDELMKRDRGGLYPPAMNSLSGPKTVPPVVTIIRRLLPDDIRVNSMVRIWGSYDKSSGQFNPRSSHDTDAPVGANSYMGHHDDMTGVRNRIKRGGMPGGMHGIPGGRSGSYPRGGGGAGGHHGR